MTDHDKIRHDFKNQLAIIQGFAEIAARRRGRRRSASAGFRGNLQSRRDRARSARPHGSRARRHADDVGRRGMATILIVDDLAANRKFL